MLHCLKHGFPSYVDASRQEGTILNGDARDYDVSTQGALAANIKVITCFTATNYVRAELFPSCRPLGVFRRHTGQAHFIGSNYENQ